MDWVWIHKPNTAGFGKLRAGELVAHVYEDGCWEVLRRNSDPDLPPTKIVGIGRDADMKAAMACAELVIREAKPKE